MGDALLLPRLGVLEASRPVQDRVGALGVCKDLVHGVLWCLGGWLWIPEATVALGDETIKRKNVIYS